jgi:hypothetical protein
MAGTDLGQSGKVGTVYDGPTPATQGTVYSGPAASPAGGTVYNGPSNSGTVYNGPGATGAIGGAGAQQPRVSSTGAVRGSRIFFYIAGFTGLNTILMFVGVRFAIGLGVAEFVGQSVGSIVLVNLLAAGVFALLGVFAKQENKTVFLVGMLLYGGDLVLLVLNNPERSIISIIFHGLFLFYLFTAFRQLPE